MARRRKTVSATELLPHDLRLIDRLLPADGYPPGLARSEDINSVIKFVLEADPSRARAKFGRWILSLLEGNQVRIPEDAPVVRVLLEGILKLRSQNKLHLLRREIGQTDLNRPRPETHEFVTRYELAKALENIFGKTPQTLVIDRYIERGQAALMYDEGSYMVVRIHEPQALVNLCQGTQLCTKYPGPAETYLKAGPVYQIWKLVDGDLQHVAQIHFATKQYMDPQDRSWTEAEWDEYTPFVALIVQQDPNLAADETIVEELRLIYNVDSLPEDYNPRIPPINYVEEVNIRKVIPDQLKDSYLWLDDVDRETGIIRLRAIVDSFAETQAGFVKDRYLAQVQDFQNKIGEIIWAYILLQTGELSPRLVLEELAFHGYDIGDEDEINLNDVLPHDFDKRTGEKRYDPNETVGEREWRYRIRWQELPFVQEQAFVFFAFLQQYARNLFVEQGLDTELDSSHAITLTRNEAGQFIDMAKRLITEQPKFIEMEGQYVAKMETTAREVLDGELTAEIPMGTMTNWPSMRKISNLAERTPSWSLYGQRPSLYEQQEGSVGQRTARTDAEPYVEETVHAFIQLLNLEYLQGIDVEKNWDWVQVQFGVFEM